MSQSTSTGLNVLSFGKQLTLERDWITFCEQHTSRSDFTDCVVSSWICTVRNIDILLLNEVGKSNIHLTHLAGKGLTRYERG